MKVININHNFRYDIQSICQIFYPGDTFKDDDQSGRELTTVLVDDKAVAELKIGGKIFKSEMNLKDFPTDNTRAAVKKAAYTALVNGTGKSSPWGSLTGIRPALFYGKILDEYGKNAKGIMKNVFSISDEKLEICEDVLKGRKNAVLKNTSDAASLYISIPFCPSRCKYCSFVSAVTDRESNLIPDYINKLLAEAEKVAELIKSDGKKISSIYVGGGTPSILSTAECKRFCEKIKKLFLDSHNILEYTFEAGRPDTITDEKLKILDAYGVTRISINPQTLNQSVLDTVGRKHTVEQFYNAYNAAMKCSLDKNIDLIVGLPGDTVESFEKSIDGCIALNPECLTIHTLYIKKAADYGASATTENVVKQADITEISQMLSYTRKMTKSNGYFPYYLYRQKNTIGNGENVGYAKSGKECLYNVWMMDDIQSVYGIGAGAVTKKLTENGAERTGNTKLPLEYLKSDKNIF